MEVIMKYITFTIFTLIFFISGCSILDRSAGNNTGIEYFEGTGRGYRGPITVQVYMIGDSFTEIIIVDSVEDRFIGAEAMDELIDMVILYNTFDLDAVSGATETSRGFLEAVENAIMTR